MHTLTRNYETDIGLFLQTEESLLFMTEYLDTPPYHKERLLQIAFEEFGPYATFFAMKDSLAVFASGRTTGLSLHVGDSLVTVAPVYEGTMLLV